MYEYTLSTHMVEGDFFQGFWSLLHLEVEWLQDPKHPRDVVLSKVQPAQVREAHELSA